MVFNKIINLPVILFIVFSVYCRPTFSQVVDIAWKQGMKLVFFDEFDSAFLNSSKWRNDLGWGRCINEMESYFTDGRNMSFRDGKLILTAKKEQLTVFCNHWDLSGKFIPFEKTYNFSSGAISSIQKFKYGYFESRFKVPKGKGFNSAFWLFGDKSCEIDVAEILGSESNRAYMTLHWQGRDHATGRRMGVTKSRLPDGSFNKEYHVMASEWTKDNVKWFIDQKEVRQEQSILKLNKRHVPDVPLYILFDLGLSQMDGYANKYTPFPSDFFVDYVRAYSFEHTEKPVITGQKTIIQKPGSSYSLSFDDFYVNDHYKNYPHGFRIDRTDSMGNLIIENPVQYSLPGIRTFYVKINDGLESGNVFKMKMLITDSQYISKDFPKDIDIISNSDSMTVNIVSRNNDVFIDNIILTDDKYNQRNYKLEVLPGNWQFKPDIKAHGLYFLVFIIKYRMFRYPVVL